MKGIKAILPGQRNLGMNKKIVFGTGKFLFSVLFMLGACPIMGQANNGIVAYLEGQRLFLQVESKLLDNPILLVRHEVGQHQVIFSKQGGHLVLTVPRIESLSGTIIPINQDFRTESLVIGRYPIIEENGPVPYYRIDATALFLETEIKWHRNFVEMPIVPGQAYIEGVGFLKGE